MAPLVMTDLLLSSSKVVARLLSETGFLSLSMQRLVRASFGTKCAGAASLPRDVPNETAEILSGHIRHLA